MERGNGILMHISSLPSKHGIGTFGKEAHAFVKFLNLAGQKYWQVLPLNPTSYEILHINLSQLLHLIPILWI